MYSALSDTDVTRRTRKIATGGDRAYDPERPFGVRDLARAGYRHKEVTPIHRRLKLPPPWSPEDCYRMLLTIHAERGYRALKRAGIRD